MLEKFNVMVSGGLGQLEGKCFRVGHMGLTATPHYIVYTISALARTLKNLGVKVDEYRPIEEFYKHIEK
jgi:aspartate aminotransferase-like enzyme